MKTQYYVGRFTGCLYKVIGNDVSKFGFNKWVRMSCLSPSEAKDAPTLYHPITERDAKKKFRAAFK
jgi:hypothetical protein